MKDEEIAKVIALATRLRITIHIRGTDERPVVQFRDKFFRTEVGGIELKRRMKAAGY